MNFPAPSLIPTNGIELEVFSAGSGKPVVLCHGWPEHAFSWRHQIEPLAKAGYHVIAPNQRGYGNSTAPAAVTDYDIEHLCGDLVGLLDHYGYEKAAFVGHDWGAIVVALSTVAAYIKDEHKARARLQVERLLKTRNPPPPPDFVE